MQQKIIAILISNKSVSLKNVELKNLVKSINEESNKERCKTETNDMIKIKNQGRTITKIEFIKNKYRALCNNITL